MHVSKLAGDGLQTGEEEVADGEPGCLAAGEDLPDVVYELFVAVVYDVVGHTFVLYPSYTDRGTQ